MVPKKTSFAIIATLLIAITPAATRSQTDFWQETTVPKGDYVVSIAFDSTGNIFAATQYGGVFRTTDNGDHWTQVNSGLPEYYATCLAGLPDSSILAGVYGGFYRSTDQGMNWNERFRTDSMSTSMSMTTDASGYFFAATGATGIFRSTNFGKTWSRTRAGLTDSTINFVRISAGRDVFAGSWTSGLFRSTDMGASWAATSLANIPVVAMVEDSPKHFIAGTCCSGVYASSDNGTSWNQSGLAGSRIRALAVTAKGRIVAGTEDGMYISTDHGASWSLIGYSGVMFTCLEVGPSGRIVAGTYGDGVIRSTDDADTWSPPFNDLTLISANQLLCTKAGTIFAATSRSVFRSTDNGVRWVQCYQGLTTTYISAIVEGDSGWIFAGTSDQGVFRSKDNGDTWGKFGPSGISIRSLAFNRTGALMAASGSVYIMSKDGSGWTQSHLPISIETARVLAVDSAGTAYAGADTGGVFISTDNGGNWHKSGLPDFPVPALTVTIRQSLLTGGYDGRVNRSTDGGSTWAFSGTGMQAWRIYFLATHPKGTLFAGTSGPGGGTLYTSTDDGLHWSALGATVPNTGVQALTFGKGEYLFIGTAGAGILKSSQPFTSIRDLTGPVAAVFSLDQNYPNPFNPSTTIRFTLSHRAQTTLTVFNLLGQQVSVLINGEVSAGSHAVTFDGSDLASGVYFYRIHAGDFVQTKKLMILR